MNYSGAWEQMLASQLHQLDAANSFLSVILQSAPLLVCVVDEHENLIFSSRHYALLHPPEQQDTLDRFFVESDLYSEVLYRQLSTIKSQPVSELVWAEFPVEYFDESIHEYRFSKIAVNNNGKSFVMTLGIEVSDSAQLDANIRDYKAVSQHYAFKDALTGLANRTLFYDRLDKILSTAKRDSRHFALMLIDIDHFREINDAHGKDVGDRYLKHVAEKFIDVIRDVDTVARIGGDKFVVILDNIEEANNIQSVANKLLEAASSTLDVDGEDVSCTASMGISLYPKDGDSTEQLLRHADMAITKAKTAGKNQHQFFIKAMTESAVNYLLLENDLQHAIDNDELLLYFQPQVNLVSGVVGGLEVLCRWQHPRRGILQPGHFIPLAEETGLIEPLGEWVLRQSTALFTKWLTLGYDFGKLSINVSARQFRNPEFNVLIKDVLAESGLSEFRLELELTESATMENAAQAVENLNQLHEAGVSIALDDFGTGYSSLSYLQRFPIQKLKIDKSFVDDIEDSEASAVTAKSIIDLAQNMELEVVAEGVERLGQMQWLKEHGCENIQGAFFSEPLSESELTTLVHNKRRIRLEGGIVRMVL